MIYTVTLNPAVDRELTVPSIEFETVLRAEKQRADIGGKGFNVSRMLSRLGEKSVALGLVGGNTGKLLCDGLEAEGIATDFVWTAEESRTNFSVVATDGDRYLKVNEPGATVSLEEQAALVEKILGAVAEGDWCILSGSLPPGLPASFYAEVIERLNKIGAKTVLDTSGDALRLGVVAKPLLITPNFFEATELTGLVELELVAQALADLGIERSLITLGSEGVISCQDGKLWRVAPPTIARRNAIGAGDAFVAGLVFALQQGLSWVDALCWGVACGTVSAGLPGTAFGDLQEIQRMLDQLTARESTDES